MPCLAVILALLLPRFTIILLVLTGDYIGRAFQTTLWPLLGFLFMPYTTLAYAAAINENGSVSGLYLALVIVAVLVDLGATGGGAAKSRPARIRHE